MKVAVFWFRRDLRLDDNTGLARALSSGLPVLPLFIFDDTILDQLPADDSRVAFIYDELKAMSDKLNEHNSGMHIRKGKPIDIWKKLISDFDIAEVYVNRDYEPYAQERDKTVHKMLEEQGIKMHGSKDQVVFEKSEVVKDDGDPYTVYTPYKNKWLKTFQPEDMAEQKWPDEFQFYDHKKPFPSRGELGFEPGAHPVPAFDDSVIEEYDQHRDYPAKNGTSGLGPHLRFGTISPRALLRREGLNKTFKSELIWREFFMQILYHFPDSATNNFRSKYDFVEWRNDEKDFEKWCQGKTGYPMVDAGMRQLNQTGQMHNRVRMVTASFLCKHLLIDWRWGERYFASKLLDYDLSANVGNWQWAAGTGCDAAPYFRVFNPTTQWEKFDPKSIYVKKWIKDFNEGLYLQPMVDHKFARERAIATYKEGIAASGQ